ncbi:MAG: hypothetical protein ACYS74_14790, partial [Planctomycetota bacterium]
MNASLKRTLTLLNPEISALAPVRASDGPAPCSATCSGLTQRPFRKVVVHLFAGYGLRQASPAQSSLAWKLGGFYLIVNVTLPSGP